MKVEEFEVLLTALTEQLTKEVQKNEEYHKPSDFEQRVRTVLESLTKDRRIKVDLSPQAQVFPDIVFGQFGIEVKVTNKDTWRSVANSVFEGTRSASVHHDYVLFGKMGGTPAVRWGRYEDCVMHVRTSHVPRFEVEMYPKKSLFAKFGITYSQFCSLPPEEKMQHVRSYARGRLKEGERLWWLEDGPDQEHSLPLEVRLYMGLSQTEKRRYRAEAALLCPQIVKPPRTKKKYDDASMFLLTYYGILCPQARDLFSAGSVALRSNSTRGGNYIMRALNDIESEMRHAAKTLEDDLFVEYWGVSASPKDRIAEWLKRADEYAKTWKPSKELFQK
jgi:hypothetical protein